MKNIYNNRKVLIIFLIFTFIFADIVCENFIGIIYNEQSNVIAFAFFLSFVIMQILFAPIQSGLSDLFGRKRSLIVSLSFSLLSLLFVYIFNLKFSYFSILIIATISKGVFGNTLPISLAVIADTRDKNYRLLFAFSTAAYALAYLVLASAVEIFSEKMLNEKINVYLILFFIVIIFCVNLLGSPEDKEGENFHLSNSRSAVSVLKNEARLLARDLKHIPTVKALAAFFFWETSLYSILLSQVDFQLNKATHIAESMMYGYLFGVFILMFCCRIKDASVIKAGYYISFLSLVPYFILFKIVGDQTFLLRVCYFFHALGNAFLSPALLSMLAKERKVHEQGRIYGLTDSVDTFGYLCATIAIMLFTMLKLELVYLISFSFFSFAVSWMFYSRFQGIKE